MLLPIMKITSKKETWVLLVGDIIVFCVSLWLTLFIRNAEYPSGEVFSSLLEPFSFIFILWVLVFYIADLYGKHTSIFRRKLPRVIFNAQLVNSTIAIIFFYFVPYFGVTPKTLLFVDLFISFFLLFGWRGWLAPNIHLNLPEKIYFACRGQEANEVMAEIKNNPGYNITIARETEIKDIKKTGITAIVVDLYDEAIAEALKNFYGMIFSGIRFIPLHTLYEELFDREPVLSIKEQWFLENISNRPKPVYDGLKRLMDTVVAGLLGLLSLVFYPFVYLAIKTEDNGVIFSEQERVGKDNQVIKLLKFRTMTNPNENGEWGKEENKVTKVGHFLRKTRIDELPQLWNILRGDISLIGPRPEFPDPVALYSQDIQYYNIRHIIKPGLSGWAQIKQEYEPHHGVDIDGTRMKFSYDLYYIKNRSFWLDLSISLKTIKILLMRKGR
ncbi:MAG: sugar transferase [Candidatus Paceibacterota bacterium]|jgi:lipopolysaccharide/colanic/teichoic acid biosynthesis glycosyltransferase